MSFAQKINQLFRRKPIAAAVSGDSSMMGDTVVQDMYDGSLNSVQGAPSVFGVEEAGVRTNW
jgi:twitching motility protein PilJ